MKKLLTILFLLTLIISSCTTTARISYKELPNKYRDYKISREIIVRDDFVYLTTISGVPQKIDTKKFNVEIRKN